jgi:hypothetical protein
MQYEFSVWIKEKKYYDTMISDSTEVLKVIISQHAVYLR